MNIPQGTANITMVDLPSIDSFDRTSVINYEDFFYDDTLFLNTSLTTQSSICDTFDNMNTINIVGIFSTPSDTSSPTGSPTYAPSEYSAPITAVRVGNPCGIFFESGLCEICTGDCDNGKHECHSFLILFDSS